MPRNGVGENIGDRDIKARIRLDFKGVERPGRFFFGGMTAEKTAEEAREQQVAIFRNVPIQGVYIEDIDLGMEVFTVFDDLTNKEIAYAPVTLMVTSDSLENIISFISQESFRKIEILAPPTIMLNRYDMERLFYKINEGIKDIGNRLEKKYNLR